MKYCDNCESAITDDYARVFGTDDGVLACPGCSSQDGIGKESARRHADRSIRL